MSRFVLFVQFDQISEVLAHLGRGSVACGVQILSIGNLPLIRVRGPSLNPQAWNLMLAGCSLSHKSCRCVSENLILVDRYFARLIYPVCAAFKVFIIVGVILPVQNFYVRIFVPVSPIIFLKLQTVLFQTSLKIFVVCLLEGRRCSHFSVEHFQLVLFDVPSQKPRGNFSRFETVTVFRVL